MLETALQSEHCIMILLGGYSADGHGHVVFIKKPCCNREKQAAEQTLCSSANQTKAIARHCFYQLFTLVAA
jgi:hypothetical protein